MGTYWGVPVDEAELLAGLPARPRDEAYTVSFFDMAGLLRARGFAASGYRMDYAQLLKAVARYAPLVVHYDRPEAHFALVLGADEEGLVVADPATGTSLIDRWSFLDRWSGNVLLARNPGPASPRGVLEAAIGATLGRRSLLEREGGPSAGGLW